MGLFYNWFFTICCSWWASNWIMLPLHNDVSLCNRHKGLLKIPSNKDIQHQPVQKDTNLYKAQLLVNSLSTPLNASTNRVVLSGEDKDMGIKHWMYWFADLQKRDGLFSQSIWNTLLPRRLGSYDSRDILPCKDSHHFTCDGERGSNSVLVHKRDTGNKSNLLTLYNFANMLLLWNNHNIAVKIFVALSIIGSSSKSRVQCLDTSNRTLRGAQVGARLNTGPGRGAQILTRGRNPKGKGGKKNIKKVVLSFPSTAEFVKTFNNDTHPADDRGRYPKPSNHDNGTRFIIQGTPGRGAEMYAAERLRKPETIHSLPMDQFDQEEVSDIMKEQADHTHYEHGEFFNGYILNYDPLYDGKSYIYPSVSVSPYNIINGWENDKRAICEQEEAVTPGLHCNLEELNETLSKIKDVVGESRDEKQIHDCICVYNSIRDFCKLDGPTKARMDQENLPNRYDAGAKMVHLYNTSGIYDADYLIFNHQKISKLKVKLLYTEDNGNITASPLGFLSHGKSFLYTTYIGRLYGFNSNFHSYQLLFSLINTNPVLDWIYQNKTETRHNPIKVKSLKTSRFSCKKKWDPKQAIFQFDPTYTFLTIQIPPWLGFSTTRIILKDRVEYKEVSVFYYQKIHQKAEDLTIKYLKHNLSSFMTVDLDNLEEDDCGCKVNQLCYKDGDEVIRYGNSRSNTDREMVYKKLDYVECNYHDSIRLAAKLTHACWTTYGIIFGYYKMNEVDKKLGVPRYVMSRSLTVSHTHKNLLLEKEEPGKKYTKGLYTSKLTLDSSEDSLFMGKVSAHETLKSTTGKYTIFKCANNQKDGSKSEAEEHIRCEKKVRLDYVILFWVSIISLCCVLIYTIYHCVRMVRPKKDEYGYNMYKIKTMLKANHNLCYLSSKTREALDETKKYAENSNERRKILSKGLDMICTDLNDTKLRKAIFYMTSYFPVTYIILFTVLSVPWVLKIIWSILCWPLKLCKIKWKIFFTFDNWYSFVCGPLLLMRKESKYSRDLKTKATSLSKGVVYYSSLNIINAIIITVIVLSSIYLPKAYGSSGQAINMISSCSNGKCRGEVYITGSTDATDGYSVSYPLIGKENIVDGSVKITVRNISYEHPLTYSFSVPSFDSAKSQIVCRSDDPDFRQFCWGRFWNQEDPDETTCHNSGPQFSAFISQNIYDAMKGIYYCRTYDPKGYWFGASSKSDGLEWSGVKWTPNFDHSGRRQWTIGNSKLKGYVEVVVTIQGETMLKEVQEIERYSDTLTFDEITGSMRVTERRVEGKSVSGEALNCKYTNLKKSIAPTCKVLNKNWEDKYNINIYGEIIDDKTDRIVSHNSVAFKRINKQEKLGDLIEYRDHQQPDANYEGSGGILRDMTTCNSKVVPGVFERTATKGRCTNADRSTKSSCVNDREGWAEVSGSMPTATLILTECSGLKLDHTINLVVDYSAKSGDIRTVDVANLKIQANGCWGRAGKLQIKIVSTTSDQGLILLSTKNKYINCPESFMVAPESNFFNCTTIIETFVLTVSETGENAKTRDFKITTKEACKTFDHDEFCNDCDHGVPLNKGATLNWKECLMIAAGSIFVILILLALCCICNPLGHRTIIKDQVKRTRIETPMRDDRDDFEQILYSDWTGNKKKGV